LEGLATAGPKNLQTDDRRGESAYLKVAEELVVRRRTLGDAAAHHHLMSMKPLTIVPTLFVNVPNLGAPATA